MEILLYLSLGLNLVLLFFILPSKTGKKPENTKDQQNPTRTESSFTPRPVVNTSLRTIAESCEAKLPEEERGKIKLLIDTDHARLAALKIGELRISLCRYGRNQSLFKINSFMDALKLAKNGYDGTGRYIPVPDEIEKILSQRHIINVYLEALELEQISEQDDFWCVDTVTGYPSGWKRFEWNEEIAFSRLYGKSGVRTHDGRYLATVEQKSYINLFLLLKGWDHLFVEV